MKRKCLSLICVLVMLFSLFSGCGGRSDTETTRKNNREDDDPTRGEIQTDDSDQEALEEQWIACLMFSEEVYTTMDWAFSYAREYARENSWESYLRANAACCAAISSLEGLELPENQMTQEQYASLMESGIEAEVVSQEYENLGASLEVSLNTMYRLMYLLRDDCYMEPSYQMLSGWLNDAEAENRYYSAYFCLLTNELLLQLDHRELWKELGTKIPWIWESAGEWNEDSEELQRSASACLDGLEEILDHQAEYLGVSEYTLSIVRDAVETGDYSRLSENIHATGGVYGYFPQPFFIPVETVWQYQIVDSETGLLRGVEAGESFEQIPAACIITCPGITWEEISAYESSLAFWGLVPRTWENTEDGSYHINLTMGQCSMEISWTGKETTVTLTDPVACVMPELYLAAMLMQGR